MTLPVRCPRPCELSELMCVTEPDVQRVVAQSPMSVQRGVYARVKDPVAVKVGKGDVARARHWKFTPRASVRGVYPATAGAPKLAVATTNQPHAIRIHLSRNPIHLPSAGARDGRSHPCKYALLGRGFPSVLNLIVLRVGDALDDKQVRRAR